MNKLTEWLIKDLIDEGIDLPIEIGDTVKMGRFKNKPVVVKSIDWNEKGDLLINGRPALKFRVVSSKTEDVVPSPKRKSLSEIDFKNKGAFQKYSATHKMRPTTKVNIGGKETTVGDVEKSNNQSVLNTIKDKKQNFDKKYKDYDNAPEFGESKKDFNKEVWRDNYIHQTEGGSSIVGTAHGHKVENKKGIEVYDPKHPDNYSIENHVIPEIEKRVEEARKAGKKVTFLTEGGKSDKDPYAGGGGDEQHHVATNAGIKFDDVKTWDGENSDISNPDAPIYDQIAKETGNTKEEEQAFMFANMFGQGDEDSVPADKLTKENKKALRNSGYKGGFPPGSGNGKVDSLKGDADYEADQQLLYLMAYPGDFESGHKDYKWAEKKYGKDHLSSLVKGKAGESAKSFNKARDIQMDKKIKEVESDGDTVAIVMPGSSHAYAMGDVVGGKKESKKSKTEDVVPSPSRKGINKNKTDKLSGYKKVDEIFPKGAGRKISKAMQKKSPTIKKVVGVYGGRFQPFGPHHKKTYEWLEKKVDEAYIVTSDLKKPPRHPMNFAEKVRHMKKMGIPSNRIIKETTPYQAKNTLKKFDERTTAVIYIFGKKDANRLKAGAYFDDYKRNKDKMVGYRERGYILTAPHQSVRVGGKEVSGTTIRDILGHPKLNDNQREKLFKKLFGYFDQGNFNMLTNKFKKLYEFFHQSSVKKLIKEVSALGSSISAGDLDDEGLYDFFNSFADYKRVSPKHAEILGWEMIGDIINFDNATDPGFDYSTSTVDRVDTVTFGKTINQTTSNEDSVDNPFPKYRAHMTNLVGKMGWEIVKFFGKPTAKMKDSHTHDMGTATAGSGNTNKPENPDKLKKIQEDYQRDVVMLIEGGAYGHMAHPFDDNNLTFSDLQQIIINGLGGKLDREDNVTEKLDGQNLMISWVDGKLKAARNKGHLKNHGKNALTTSGVKSLFSGRGDIEKAFVGAMKDLEKSIGKLSDAQKEKIFGNGSKWMNLEVMYPATANIIDYDVAEIVFHGAIEYDDSGKAIGQPRDSARMLEGMIRQVNANIQKRFKISKPNFLTVPKSQNFGKNKTRFLGKLKKLQSTYALKDTDELGEYHQAYWREYVFNASKQFGVSLKPNQFVSLVNRWAYFDKSYKIVDIKKDYKDKPKFLDWILSTDKNDIEKIFKQNIKPFEVLFFEVGAEILKNISGYMAASPEKATQKIRKEVTKALSDLKRGGNVDKLKKLKLQIEKLQAIGGLDAVVPSEGVVFKYKGKIYKFTGAFAPINQILGSLKFG